MVLKGGRGIPAAEGCAAACSSVVARRPERKFFVTIDASDFAIGAVLSQVWDDGAHPGTYESGKLNVAEGNYVTHEKELLAVIPYGPSISICWGIISL